MTTFERAEVEAAFLDFVKAGDAGDGLWSFQDDIYNPREAQAVIGSWIEAGGVLAAPM